MGQELQGRGMGQELQGLGRGGGWDRNCRGRGGDGTGTAGEGDGTGTGRDCMGQEGVEAPAVHTQASSSRGWGCILRTTATPVSD